MGLVGCQNGRGAGGPLSGAPLHIVPESFGGLWSGASTAVVGRVTAIESQARSAFSQRTVLIDGQTVSEAYDRYRGQIAIERVMLASYACRDQVLAVNNFDYRWLSQLDAEYPRFVLPNGATVPRDRLPLGSLIKRYPGQTLVVGERALFFAGCPTKTFCASNDCPNDIFWKIPILEGDVVDLSSLRVPDEEAATTGVLFGSTRTPLVEAVARISAAINAGYPAKGAVIVSPEASAAAISASGAQPR